MNAKSPQCPNSDLFFETGCRVLENILERNKKHSLLCPLCRKPYARSDSVFKHCRDMSERKNDNMGEKEKLECDIHGAIGQVNMQNGDFIKFRHGLAAACGRDEISAKELPLSHIRSYGSCLGLEFIVDMMTSTTETKYHLLRDIVRNSGIHFTCPECWEGLAKPGDIVKHCQTKNDENHKGLLSKNIESFFELYGNLLGQRVDPSGIEIDFDGDANPDFHRCFDIDKILRNMR